MKPQSYTPPDRILEKYAELIVSFGLQNRHGKLPKKGSVIRFTVTEAARPLFFHLQTAILKHGYNPYGVYLPNSDEDYNFAENFYNHATKAQLEFVPKKSAGNNTEAFSGSIRIIAETSPHALSNINSKKIMARTNAQKTTKDQLLKKFNEGTMSWTIALYGTDAAAKEAGLSLKEYWNQIIKACYLDKKDPVKEWYRINNTIKKTADKLTSMKIESLHIKGRDMDLTVGIGKNRAWKAGGGNNIPSFEVFTSPNWRTVNGWAKFNQPHYRYGQKIEGIELWFKNGKVVKSKASKGYDLLKSILKADGGDQVGEFSLTDARLSRITKPMAEILYDENIGGKYGNTHIALGSAYKDCFKGDMSKMTEKDWRDAGYNDSSVHSDIISTTDRTVIATLQDGKEKVIYKKGKFVI